MIATQNPIEFDGTYSLPQAQLDRFMVRLSLGYPSAAEESAMLADHAAGDRVLGLSPVSTVAEVVAAQDALGAVHIERAAAPLRRRPRRRDPRATRARSSARARVRG